jgi:23S rRNA (cytidine1920-2'-O)/16S rRNA (cytidine1409-2'-O)-methyltransferase
VKRQRLDKALVERGIARSRSQAKDLVEAGEVLVDGFPVKKPASEISDEDSISLVNPDRAEWVGRGGRKIEPILEAGWLSVQDRVFLDVGSSTGGFTQALLRAGVRHVHAVDAGEGQLAFELRQDDRVSVHEQYNFRYADPEDFEPEPAAFVMDVSFISTCKLIPALNEVLPADADGVFLLKPQFEAEADENVDGIVRDPSVLRRVLDDVMTRWNEEGWGATKLAPSPLKGTTGNQEYFVRVERGQPRDVSRDDIQSVSFEPGTDPDSADG